MYVLEFNITEKLIKSCVCFTMLFWQYLCSMHFITDIQSSDGTQINTYFSNANAMLAQDMHHDKCKLAK